MEAIGYIRVSTTGQATDGVSLSAQRQRITAWCLATGYELIAVPSEQAMAHRARTLRAAGLSLRAIGHRLTTEGFGPRRSRGWHAKTVGALLAAGMPRPPAGQPAPATYAARLRVLAVRCRATSPLRAPSLNSERTSRSTLTEGSPDSIFAIRD